jgi:DNA-directed RNA polymerase specialized sigma24 family protein
MKMRSLVRGVLHRRGIPHPEIPDLTQTVLLALLDWWATRGSPQTPDQWRETRAYVALVAERAAFAYHRTALHRGELTASGDTQFLPFNNHYSPDTPTEPSPEDTALAAEARAALASALDLDTLAAATSPAFWRAFYGHLVLEVPVSLIADSERVPTATIYNRIRLAREDLRAFFRRRAARRH